MRMPAMTGIYQDAIHSGIIGGVPRAVVTRHVAIASFFILWGKQCVLREETQIVI